MKSKIPSLLAIFILMIGLGASVFIIKETQSFKSSAQNNLSPIDVKITNIKDDSFTVTWVTETQTIGFVEYKGGESAPTTNSITHLVTIQNLAPATSYSFRINSNGQFFDNSPSFWSAQTLSSQLNKDGTVISGSVFDKNNFPAKNALVFVDTGTTTWATTVSTSGNWILTIPPLPDSTTLQVLVESSSNSLASAKINLGQANPVPLMTMGSSYDFRNENSQSQSDIPQVPIQLP